MKMHVNFCNLWLTLGKYLPLPRPLPPTPLCSAAFMVVLRFAAFFARYSRAGNAQTTIPHPKPPSPIRQLPHTRCGTGTGTASLPACQLFLLVFMSLHVFPSALSPATALALSNPSIFSKKLCKTLEWGLIFK